MAWPSSPAASSSGTARASRWRASTSRCRTARSTASSAPTAPARRPPCGCWWGSSGRLRDHRGLRHAVFVARPPAPSTDRGAHRDARVLPLPVGPRQPAHVRRDRPAAARSRPDEVLDAVGLTDRAKDKVKTYSLGMRQRLGIAVALLSDPELLLLDEPANGLDPAGIVAMRELLRYLTDQGKTVLVSSHILPEVQQLADVVGIIDRGRLVREGASRSCWRGRAGPRPGPPRPGRGGGAGARDDGCARRAGASRRVGHGLDHGAGARRAGRGGQPAAREERASSPRLESRQRPRVGLPLAHRGHGQDSAEPGGGPPAGWGSPGYPMIGLVRAELLKLRDAGRPTSCSASGRPDGADLPAIGVVATAARSRASDLVTRFPAAYGFINQFVFGLGSLLAVAYAAAIGGADWSWGVMRVVIARGEGRARYVVAKAIGLAIVLFVGTAPGYAAGIALSRRAAGAGGRARPASRSAPAGTRDALVSLALGTFVLSSAPPSASRWRSCCAASSRAWWSASCCTSARRSSRRS